MESAIVRDLGSGPGLAHVMEDTGDTEDVQLRIRGTSPRLSISTAIFQSASRRAGRRRAQRLRVLTESMCNLSVTILPLDRPVSRAYGPHAVHLRGGAYATRRGGDSWSTSPLMFRGISRDGACGTEGVGPANNCPATRRSQEVSGRRGLHQDRAPWLRRGRMPAHRTARKPGLHLFEDVHCR